MPRNKFQRGRFVLRENPDTTYYNMVPRPLKGMGLALIPLTFEVLDRGPNYSPNKKNKKPMLTTVIARFAEHNEASELINLLHRLNPSGKAQAEAA